MAASEASARIRQELVRWRNEFRAAKGRDPAKDEVPEEHKKMLRQLRDSTNLPRTSGPRGGGGGGGDRGEDSDSHVSGSPVRRDRVLDTIPRRSAGKLPGAQALAAVIVGAVADGREVAKNWGRVHRVMASMVASAVG